MSTQLFDMGLFFNKKVTSSLVGFTDTAFDGDLDDRRSTSGYVFLSGGTSISWCSKKQNSASLSTTEEEYKAAQECIWLQRLANNLHLPITKPTALFGDNQSALSSRIIQYFMQEPRILRLSITLLEKRFLITPSTRLK